MQIPFRPFPLARTVVCTVLLPGLLFAQSSPRVLDTMTFYGES